MQILLKRLAHFSLQENIFLPNICTRVSWILQCDVESDQEAWMIQDERTAFRLCVLYGFFSRNSLRDKGVQ